jgi:arabinose-5-phosphate isomerase
MNEITEAPRKTWFWELAAGVIDADGSLAGVITDGDLRRKFASLTTATASTVITPHPIVIPASMIVRDALTRLHANAITAAFVVAGDGDAHQPPIGIVHLHDLLRLEMD